MWGVGRAFISFILSEICESPFPLILEGGGEMVG